MRELETASRLFCISIADFQRALNEEFRLRELTARSEGAYFPERQAEAQVRVEFTRLLGAGSFSPTQETALLAVLGAWQPPHPKK